LNPKIELPPGSKNYISGGDNCFLSNIFKRSVLQRATIQTECISKLDKGRN